MTTALAESREVTSPGPATGVLEALRHRFRVETNLPELATYLTEILLPLSAPARLADHCYEILVDGHGVSAVGIDGVPIVTGVALPMAMEWLLWHVNQSAAASVAGQVALHAGGIQAGAAGILLPGPSGAGKSSLVAALVERGLGYLSDELMVLDGDTMVGLRRPLALRPAAQQVLPRWRPSPGVVAASGPTWLVDPDRVVPGSVGRPCRPGFVISPRFSAGSKTSLIELTTPQGLVELVGNSVRFGAPDPAHVRVLADLARRCRCYRLEFGSLDEASRIVQALVTAR